MNLKLLCFMLCLPFINSQNSDSTPVTESKIMGGADELIKNAAFMAMLQNGNSIFCNAVQISSHWLTSTAECLLFIIKNSLSVFVKAGTAFPGRSSDKYAVKKMVPHERFNNLTFQNNIGLVQIFGKGIVPNQYKAPIQLMDGPIQVKFTIGLFSYGARMRGGQEAYMLQKANTTVLNELECPSVPKGTFCVGSNTVAACRGDSGGAAVYNQKLAGIISSTVTNCIRNAPILITRIFSFRVWIKSISGV